MGRLLVGGGCYCCTGVLLLHCPVPTLARRSSLARSIAPSIARRHHRPGVLGPLSSNARRRPIARLLARPLSLARRRSPAVACSPPPPSFGQPLAAVVARPPSPARSPAVARPPLFLYLTYTQDTQKKVPGKLQQQKVVPGTLLLQQLVPGTTAAYSQQDRRRASDGG